MGKKNKSHSDMKSAVKKDFTTELNLRHLSEVCRDLNDAMAAKYGAYLKPGESLTIEIEREVKVVSSSVVLEDDEHSNRFELEAAWLPQDQEELDVGELGRERLKDIEVSLDDILDQVVDFIDVQLEDYFEGERFIRFNDDWRKAEYFGDILRYRSTLKRPSLDKLADEWIKLGGDPNLINKLDVDGEKEDSLSHEACSLDVEE